MIHKCSSQQFIRMNLKVNRCLFILPNQVTSRMFALKPAPKSRPTPLGVILSVASRDLFLPEIVPLRFLGGRRNRRISPRFHLTSKAATAHFLAKSVGICTYEIREANACKISTYKISRLKTVQNQHLQKILEGEGRERISFAH